MRTFVPAACLCAAGLAACGRAADPLPFKPVATVDQLMDAVITPAAETYWDSVATIVDKNGITEKFPRTDQEWEAVWGAAMTIAEAGNLLMMPPRAHADGDWMRFAAELVDRGVEAAKAAEARSPEAVLDAGERVYNVCTGCHMQYLVEEE